MHMEKHVLVKEIFINGLNMGLSLWARVKDSGNTDFLVKKKFWVQQTVKVMLTVFWDIKGPMTLDLFEKVQL